MIDQYPGTTPRAGLQSEEAGEAYAPYAAGVVKILSAKQQDEERQRLAEASQQRPIIQDLAAYVRKAFDDARTAKQPVEQRIAKCIRQRRGEYDPDKLEAIRKQGGSEIYMMLTSVKCRAAASWLRDAMMGSGSNKPWSLKPTPVPELPQVVLDAIEHRVMLDVQQFLSVGGLMPSQEMIENAKRIAADRLRIEQQTAAKKATELQETKMEDQLVQGGFHEALSQFIDDLVTFPAAILKGPVVRRKKKLEWGPNQEPVVEEDLCLEWERVDPLNLYPSRYAEHIDDGYLIERHKLSRSDLHSLIGVEGYNEPAIRQVLHEYSTGGLHEWLSADTARQGDEHRSFHTENTADATIDALQFWGDVPGRMLVEWGLDEDQISDREADYSCEVWLIGRWVIKAVLNPDPLARRPYFKASYETVPGDFWGHGVPDLIRDTQDVCNAAARSLVNNMALASGPQVWVNIDRMPPGEDVTQMYPWKMYQMTSDPLGGNGQPIGFFQPNSLAGELMAVYEKFSNLADEYSGVPKYMTGTEGTPGAGRTASGLSMMINNAGKIIKQVLSTLDVHVITPLIEYLYYYNMRYSDDPELKGDVQIVARGASGVIAREAAQVRINEFLNLAIGNQTVTQIIGPEGVAALLRASMKGLEMDTDKIVPSEEAVRAQHLAQQNAQEQMLRQQQMMAEQQAQQPIESANPPHGQNGGAIGAGAMPGNGQQLMDGAPVTDIFQPVGSYQ